MQHHRRPAARKKPAGGASSTARREPTHPHVNANLDAEEAHYVRRKVAFAILAALVTAGALLFAFSTLEDRSENPDMRIEGRRHTVRLMVVSQERRRVAEDMLTHETILRLAPGRKPFLCTLPDGRVAMCAGRFDGPHEAEAKELLARVQVFEHRGRRPFAKACLWSYVPSEPD